MLNNPFQPLKDKPKSTVTDYHKDEDKYIITYGEVESVNILEDENNFDIKKSTNKFLLHKVVKELDRVDRQAYYDSQADEVGILNIIQKVRLSGDITLLNQTGRIPMAAIEKDQFGHDLEPVVDVRKYQVGQVAALESYKQGAAAFDSLDSDLKKKMSLEQVAKMSDAEIDAFLKSRVDAFNKVKESDGN